MIFWVCPIVVNLSLASSHTPLSPVVLRDTVETNTFHGCRKILMFLIEQNREICQLEGYFLPSWDSVASIHVRYCSATEKAQGICHARFNCLVLQNQQGCTAQQLNEGMSREFVLNCMPSFGSEQRVWIEPRYENDPLRSVAYCVSEVNWRNKTGLQWMPTDAEQEELRQVTAVAHLDLTTKLGSDVISCVDHFLRSDSNEP